MIFPGKDTDNFRFAAWAAENALELFKLGVSTHFGEWYGQGIQRGYGLQERRFALFNVHQWAKGYYAMREGHDTDFPKCCEVVPTLYTGAFDTMRIEYLMAQLKNEGSRAVPGFINPEGIIVYHTAAKTLFKKTFDGDRHKEAA